MVNKIKKEFQNKEFQDFFKSFILLSTLFFGSCCFLWGVFDFIIDFNKQNVDSGIVLIFAGLSVLVFYFTISASLFISKKNGWFDNALIYQKKHLGWTR